MPSRDSESGETDLPLHRPVLLREVLKSLELQPGLTVVDGTVGAAGHSQEIIKQISPTGQLIGLDRDPMMLNYASQSLPEAGCSLHHASYVELSTVLENIGLAVVDRVLLDLGLSSDQLADDKRGFGFDSNGPLDLRFDTTRGVPAWKLIEQHDEAELASIFHDWGEERFSRQIANRLIECRAESPVRTARDLVQAVSESVPAGQLGRARKPSCNTSLSGVANRSQRRIAASRGIPSPGTSCKSETWRNRSHYFVPFIGRPLGQKCFSGC